MQRKIKNQDKAGRSYWDKTERNNKIEFKPFAPVGGVRGFGKRMWNDLFATTYCSIPGSNKKLLELGCGGSAYLPYFAQEFGFDVYGIDYSEQGSELARKMCEVNGVSAKIICSDFFEAPSELLGQFDVVVSFGVLEHFNDTAATLTKFVRFLRPGGVMLTIVPNMSGLTGLGQKILARDVFDVHEIIDTERLHNAHVDAGLITVTNRYFMFLNFGVINLGVNPSLFKRFFFLVLKAITGLVWAIESVIGYMPPNRFSSPYVVCVSRAPVDL